MNSHSAVFPPSLVLTVMVALPTDTPVTIPSASTAATAGLLLCQVTVLSVALPGLMEAFRNTKAPSARVILESGRVTPVTGTGGVTVTAQVAVFPPSAVLTVMIAVPSLTPVTVPAASTAAMEGLELSHATLLFEAFAGEREAVRVQVLP